MGNDAKVELWDKFWGLPGKQQLTLVTATLGLIAAAFSGGWYLSYQYAALKFENEIEDAQLDKRDLERKIADIKADPSPKNCSPKEVCQGVNLADGEEVVETSMLTELMQRPEKCEASVKCDGITLKTGQSVIDDSDLKALHVQADQCRAVDDENLCAKPKPAGEDCITEGTLDEVLQNFGEHDRSANERIFEQHYLNRWVCGEGWRIELTSIPSKEAYQYWQLVGYNRPNDSLEMRSSTKGVHVLLRDGSDVRKLKNGSKIWVHGKLVSGGNGSFQLAEGTYRLDN